MKPKTPRVTARPVQRQAAEVPAKKRGHGWGFRWHAGHFRTALWLAVVAVGIVLTFGQTSGALAQWYLQDGYVATRATVVKAPFWADALAPKSDYDDAIAGWHIELRVGEYPFTLAVALADFDPDKNSVDQKIVPDASRYAVGSVLPVWFYADNKKKQPETVSLLQGVPVLLISRAAFSGFPSLGEAIENSKELLIVPGLLLFLVVLLLVASFVGKRGGNTAGPAMASRLSFVFGAGVVAFAVYLVNNEHPLAGEEHLYTPAEIEITRAPMPVDQLTYYSGYRVLWRTWQVQAKLITPAASAGSNVPEFTIDVDGLDPHRTPWASRHSPDFAVFQPGSKLPVWRSTFHGSSLDNIGSMKPVIFWQTFLSRERWPNRYTTQDFIKDNPVPVVVILGALLLALIWLVPLGGRRG